MKFKKDDILIVDNPIRLYKVFEFVHGGLGITYVGPDKPHDIDPIESILRAKYNDYRGFRLATKAEIVLYCSEG